MARHHTDSIPLHVNLSVINDVQRERDRASVDWQHRLHRVAFACAQ